MSRISEIDGDVGRDAAAQLAKAARAQRANGGESAAPAEASERVTPGREGGLAATGRHAGSEAYEVALVPGTSRIVTSIIDYEQGKVRFRIPTYWDYIERTAAPPREETGYL